MKTDAVLKQEVMKLIISNFGEVDTERFIVMINRDTFDYTEWRRNHLPEEPTVRELSRKASEYAKTHPYTGNATRI